MYKVLLVLILSECTVSKCHHDDIYVIRTPLVCQHFVRLVEVVSFEEITSETRDEGQWNTRRLVISK